MENTEVPSGSDKPIEKVEDNFGYDLPANEETAAEPVAQTDYQALINEALTKVDDNGKVVYPEDMDPAFKAAVAATKSFRDTQSGYTKATQDNKLKEAEIEALREKLAATITPTISLTPDEKTKLNELKYTDPDAWFQQMRTLETQASAHVDKELTEVTEKAKDKTVQELRLDALKEFNANREVPLTPELLEAETPPKFVNQLNEGKVSFEEFLLTASAFIDGTKTVVSPKAPTTTDLTGLNGGTTLKDKDKSGELDYGHTTF